MASMTTGTIHQFWDWYDQELGSCNCPSEPLRIDHVRVLSVHGGRATVDVQATLQAEDHVTTISGPMRLVKLRGWYIADYMRNGLDFAKTIAPRHGREVVAGDIRVQVIGVDRDGRGEEVWFRATNERPADVGIVAFDAFAGSIKLRRFMWRPGISDLNAGRSFVTQIEWLARAPLRPGSPLEVHLLFQDLTTGDLIPIRFKTTA
jgi:hypothetical protein